MKYYVLLYNGNDYDSPIDQFFGAFNSVEDAQKYMATTYPALKLEWKHLGEDTFWEHWLCNGDFGPDTYDIYPYEIGTSFRS